MYARSTSFNGLPEALDAGVTYIRDHVMPMVTAMDGCTGLSMMANRESGLCIATSGWTTIDAMRAGDEALRPIRSRAGRILGAAPQSDEWEVAVMHREHPTADGACARATWLDMAPAKIENCIDVFRMSALPRLDDIEGFCSASMLVDRQRGRCVVTSTYDNRSLFEAALTVADRIRNESVDEVGAAIRQIAEFELVLAHLHVPETA